MGCTMADFGPELLRHIKKNWWKGALIILTIVVGAFLIIRGIGTL
jgi:hypothetical protein